MMNKNEFCKELGEAVKAKLHEMGTEVEIETREVTKNNGNVKTALAFSDGSNVQSVFYVDGMYESYADGEREIEEFADGVAQNYMINRPTEEFNLNGIFDYEKAKDHIVVSVRNASLNEEMLKSVPHEQVGDLAVMYRVELNDCPGGGTGSVVINDQIMEKYEIDYETLRAQAWKNTREQQPYNLTSMFETLKGMLPGIENEMPDDMLAQTDVGMYVLTNESKTNGAFYLCDNETLKAIADKLGADLIILPSSVHECIILPDRGFEDLENLREMVKEVNDTQVAPDEILSYNVYRYDAQTQELSVYDGQNNDMAMNFQQ